MIKEQMDEVESSTERLFRALASADIPEIKQCYTPDATYSDPVFGDLGAGSAQRIWPFILAHIQRAKWHFEIVDVGIDSAKISSRVDFDFALTGRPVSLQIRSRVYERNSLITSHEDDFDLPAWSRMALHIKHRAGLCAPYGLKTLKLSARKTFSTPESESCSQLASEVSQLQRPVPVWSFPALASARLLASNTWRPAKQSKRS
jgi:SnoaL-like domain